MSSPQDPATPSRPRIRKAHSARTEYRDHPAHAASSPPNGVAAWPSNGAAPAHGRSSAGPAYGAGTAAPAQPAGPPPASSSSSPQSSAAHDRSTYYEYLAQRTGESTPPPPVGPVPAAAPSGPPQPLRWRALVAVFAVVAVLAAAAIVLGVTLLGPDRGTHTTDLESSAPTPSSTAPSPTAEVDVTAGEQLGDYADEGTAVAEERLAEQWVVQLSAKKSGLEANGRTWAEEDILAEFEENQRRHPDAILLWSGDWSSFRLEDFWITVLAEPYDDPEAALETCRNLGLDRDNCFAKKLSTSEGPDGTTRLND